MPMSRSPQAPAEAPANTQEPATKKANRERLTFIYWWREAESNSSPQATQNSDCEATYELLNCSSTARRIFHEPDDRRSTHPVLRAKYSNKDIATTSVNYSVHYDEFTIMTSKGHGVAITQ